MSEAKPVTVERASETLERFIAEHERALAKLRAENERLRESRNEFYHAAEGRRLANSDLRRRIVELRARVAELEAENERLRADAERYRWIRDAHGGPWIGGDGREYQTLDAAIDAAIIMTKEQKT